MAENIKENRPLDEVIKEFEGLPEAARAELINGEIFLQAAAASGHQFVETNLTGLLVAEMRNRRKSGNDGGGSDNYWRISVEQGIFYDKKNRFLHDLVAWKSEKMPQAPAENFCKTLPDFVCEVVSTNAFNDYVRKYKVLRENSIPYYWIVTYKEDKSLKVLEYHDGDYQEELTIDENNKGPLLLKPFGIEISFDDVFDGI